MRERAAAFRAEMERRRSVRVFAERPVPIDVVEDCVRTAASAPSGANAQPWHFVVVTDAELKRRIREEAESVERAFYRAEHTEAWRADLAPLGTGPEKPFLEKAPVLIGVFVERFGVNPDGSRRRHYYATESVGIASGFLIAALHHVGLAVLPYTPSPMGFLGEVLNRPRNERPFALLVVGYPADGARVPELERKSLPEVATFL
jgi:iodotyrosine deiodinase